MLRLLQHPVAQQLPPQAAQGLVLLARKKRCLWALKALLEHLPAVVPAGEVEALLHSGLQGQLQGRRGDVGFGQNPSISVKYLLQQLPGALQLSEGAMWRVIYTAKKNRDAASLQLLLAHCGAIPSLSVGFFRKLVTVVLRLDYRWNRRERVRILLRCRPLEEWEGLPEGVL